MAKSEPPFCTVMRYRDANFDALVDPLSQEKMEFGGQCTAPGRAQACRRELARGEHVDQEGLPRRICRKTEIYLCHPRSRSEADIGSVNQDAGSAGNIEHLHRAFIRVVHNEKVAVPYELA